MTGGSVRSYEVVSARLGTDAKIGQEGIFTDSVDCPSGVMDGFATSRTFRDIH